MNPESSQVVFTRMFNDCLFIKREKGNGIGGVMPWPRLIPAVESGRDTRETQFRSPKTKDASATIAIRMKNLLNIVQFPITF